MHEPATPLPPLLARHPWVPFVLPMLVYMLAGHFLEPSAPDPLPATTSTDPAELAARREIASGSKSLFGLKIHYEHYPVVYTVKIVLTTAALVLVWPAYRQWPCRVSWLAFAVGAVGVVVWVGLCQLELEARLLSLLGLESWLKVGERPGFNPFDQLRETPGWAYTFLAIRFFGLVLVVPVIEEMLYRAFFMRVVMDDSPWWEIPFGTVNNKAVAVGILLPALVHPGEILAAVAWFGMVTWLMVRTKNIWDCVAAHAITNLLLGIYVITSGQWQLW